MRIRTARGQGWQTAKDLTLKRLARSFSRRVYSWMTRGRGAETPGGPILGFLTAIHHGPVSCINYLVVQAERRGGGVGRALLETAMVELSRRGVRRIGGFVAQRSPLLRWLDTLPVVRRGKLFCWYESALSPLGQPELPDQEPER